MIKAKIENGKETQYLELPCEQETLNAKVGGGDDEIKISFFGESEFEKNLISSIRSGNRLSTINCICGFYENLPSVDKIDIQDAVMSGRVFSFSDFGKLVIDRRQQDVTEYYYCPLVAKVYLRDEYGGYDEYPDDYGGDFLVQYKDFSDAHIDAIEILLSRLYEKFCITDATDYDGRLPNRVMMYLDEFGTIPKIEGAEMMFSASRSRRVSIVAIIQSFAQLQKNYGKEGCEIITDNTQLTIFGGFAPNSESAQVLSKALGTKTVQSGSISRGRNDPSQSLQMIERALMTPDELKSLPKGTFCVMKTGFYPMLVKLKLFFKWGIEFPKEIYTVPDKGNRTVSYANKKMLEDPIVSMYPPKSVGEKVVTEKTGFSLAKSNEQRKDGGADAGVRNDLP